MGWLWRLEDVRIGVIRHLEVLLCRISYRRGVCRKSPVCVNLKIGLLYIGSDILRYSLHVLLAGCHLRLKLVLGQVPHLVGGCVVTLLTSRVGTQTYILRSKLYSRRLTYWHRVCELARLILFRLLSIVKILLNLIASTKVTANLVQVLEAGLIVN